MPFDIGRRSPFAGDSRCNLRGRDHFDGVPGTPAFAQVAADTAVQVDVHEALHHRQVFAGHLVNAIDGTKFDARLACWQLSALTTASTFGSFLRLARSLRHDRRSCILTACTAWF